MDADAYLIQGTRMGWANPNNISNKRESNLYKASVVSCIKIALEPK